MCANLPSCLQLSSLLLTHPFDLIFCKFLSVFNNTTTCDYSFLLKSALFSTYLLLKLLLLKILALCQQKEFYQPKILALPYRVLLLVLHFSQSQLVFSPTNSCSYSAIHSDHSSRHILNKKLQRKKTINSILQE